MRHENIINCLCNPAPTLLVNKDWYLSITTKEGWRGLNSSVLRVRKPSVLVNEDVLTVSHSPLGPLFYDLPTFQNTPPSKGTLIFLCIKNCPIWKKTLLWKTYGREKSYFQAISTLALPTLHHWIYAIPWNPYHQGLLEGIMNSISSNEFSFDFHDDPTRIYGSFALCHCIMW